MHPMHPKSETKDGLAELWTLFDKGQPLSNQQLLQLHAQAKAGLEYFNSRGMLLPLAKKRTEEDVHTLGKILKIRGVDT